MGVSVFSGLVGSAGSAELTSAIERAEAELFGLYTAQSVAVLRDYYQRAIADDDKYLAPAVNNAVDSLVPLKNYLRAELMGFDALKEDDLAQMTYSVGELSVSEGFVTLSGEGKLRYSNAAENGIVGSSPFATPMSDCDGLVMKINADTACRLSIEVGRRGSENDCVFVIGNVAVASGEKYYFFDFELFGDLPLDGSLNYLSLTFDGASSVTFGELHAANNTETAVKREYKETPLKTLNFNSENYYKLLQKGSNLALTFIEKPTDGESFVFTESTEDDAAQLWQIVKDTKEQNSYRIINKKFGIVIFPDSYFSTLNYGYPIMADTNQEWTFSYTSKGFSITIPQTCALSYVKDIARISKNISTAKKFDIVEIEGEKWDQVWNDEFDFLNTDVWNVTEGINRTAFEPFYAKKENVYTEDGNLVIKTVKESYGGRPATSGWLDTAYNVHFNYGRFEMSAKLPKGRKIWPAFWLMGVDDGWPFCGEIDIMEMTGGGDEQNWLPECESIATVHFPDENGNHASHGGWEVPLRNDSMLSEDYHIYAVEWDESQIRWYFDDILYHSFNIETPSQKHALTNNPMYILLDTSIQSSVENQLPEGFPDEAYYYIDYIRYYKEDSCAEPELTKIEEDKLLMETNSYRHYSPASKNSFTMVGDVFVHSDRNSEFTVYDMKTGTHNTIFLNKKAPVNNAVAANGKRFAVSHWNRLSSISLDGDKLTSKCIITNIQFDMLAVSNDGNLIYAAAGVVNPFESFPSESDRSSLRIYDANSLEVIYQEEKSTSTRVIEIAPNGSYAIADYDGALRIRSAENEPVADLLLESYGVDLAFTNDSSRLYAVDAKGNIYVYDFESGTFEVFSSFCPDEAFQIEVSRDGKLIAVAYGDSCARVFDTESRKLVARLTIGSLAVMSVSFSPDASLLAAATNDGKVGIFDIDSQLLLASAEDTFREVTCYPLVTFNSDGTKLFATSNLPPFDSKTLEWDVPQELYSEKADYSALDCIEYVDEYLYTPESYLAYATALKNASSLRKNRYATAEQIAQAASELLAAKSLLEAKPEGKMGDLDADGNITVSDALVALRIAAKMAEGTATDLALGDIDKDGKITVSDSLAILRVAAKMADSL